MHRCAVKAAIPGFGPDGFGREVAQLTGDTYRESPRHEMVGFVDEDPAMVGAVLNGYPVLGAAGVVTSMPGTSIAEVGADPVTRMRIVEGLRRQEGTFPNLIHPSVVMSAEVIMDIGNIICAGSILPVNIRLGDFCQLNLKTR